MKTREDLIAEIQKLFVGTPSEYRVLSGAMVGKSELALEKIALELQRRSAQRAYNRLTLTRSGLADTETNFAKIDAKLGPHYTIQGFRDAIAQYPAFKQSLQWDAEPFAALVQEEQKQAAEEKRHFALFVMCANTATKNGKNVAPNQANLGVSGGSLLRLFKIVHGLRRRNPSFGDDVVDRRLHSERVMLRE